MDFEFWSFGIIDKIFREVLKLFLLNSFPALKPSIRLNQIGQGWIFLLFNLLILIYLNTGGPPLTWKSLTRFPLPRFLAYVPASPKMRVRWGPSVIMKPLRLKLVSLELNHFEVIAGLFWQIGVHSKWFVLFALFEDFSQ